ncbi:putative signal peptidase I [Daldinia vernicosa]|uniref:putative signal peptidase I n=1 Tax=Daldinia vernicosa TaxID=114800 RepID=UPI0020078461|nr:putative signal peptidase I [Daldinia vernicosa]KAI0849140.1 putative signal peptidase I [Daldinia vernicosa]
MRNSLRRLLPIVHVISALFILWKGLSILTNSPCPIHVVVSDSMAPTFKRGDIIIVSNQEQEIQIGDIPVVWFSKAPLPMVHRAIKIIWRARPGSRVTEQLILTKGDNNEMDDVALYPGNRKYIYRDEIIGVVRGYVPYLGWITILLNEMPYLKVGLLANLVSLSIFT